MFDPIAQMNPWTSGMYGASQPYGLGFQQFASTPVFGFPGSAPGFQGVSPFAQGGFLPQPAPQAWYGNHLGTFQGQFNNPMAQQVVQQIPQLVQNAHQIAQQAPQLIQQIPQLFQQNPQLAQQAPQLQQVPQLLQQAAILAQQVPQLLHALCTAPQTQAGAFGSAPFLANRPFA